MPDVILPVLNEAEAIPWVLGALPAGYRPIVVDNGSTDGSGRIASSLGALVVHEPQRGFGAACWAGLQTATSDVVCFMDCDGSLDPADLPLVAGPVTQHRMDLICGRRVPAPGSWPVHVRWANRFLARRVRARTGVRMRDLGPMRAAHTQALRALDIRDRRFGWPLEMVLKAAAAGWRIGEVDVPYRPRVGRSKVTGTLLGVLRTTADMGSLLR